MQPKVYIVSLSLRLPHRALCPFTSVTVHWGKGTHQVWGGLLNTGSKLTFIPEDPECPYVSPVRVGASGDHVIS